MPQVRARIRGLGNDATESSERFYVALELQPVHTREGFADHAVDERPALDHRLENPPLDLWIKQGGIGGRPSQEPNAGRKGVRSPVANAADDQVVGRHPAGDQPTPGDVSPEDVP